MVKLELSGDDPAPILWAAADQALLGGRELWTYGGENVELWLESAKPLGEVLVQVRTVAKPNVVELRHRGGREKYEFTGDAAISQRPLHLEDGVKNGRGNWLYRLELKSQARRQADLDRRVGGRQLHRRRLRLHRHSRGAAARPLPDRVGELRLPARGQAPASTAWPWSAPKTPAPSPGRAAAPRGALRRPLARQRGQQGPGDPRAFAAPLPARAGRRRRQLAEDKGARAARQLSSWSSTRSTKTSPGSPTKTAAHLPPKGRSPAPPLSHRLADPRLPLEWHRIASWIPPIPNLRLLAQRYRPFPFIYHRQRCIDMKCTSVANFLMLLCLWMNVEHEWL